MRRRGLFAGLLAVVAVKAQVIRPFIAADGDLLTRKVKPANGECPVCGTMRTEKIAPSNSPCNGSTGSNTDCLTITNMKVSAMVRCSFCNAAFWQDSEPLAK